MILKGLSGKTYQTKPKPFSSGGEGDVFELVGISDKVVKIYHADRTSQELEQKLRVMVRRPPSSSVLSQVAWPLDVVYDENRKFCGFVMPRLSITAELNEIYPYPPTTGITYQQKLIIAQNICVVISEVHRAGYVFGDFNPHNIGINTNTGTVAFLDTDSYHIQDGNNTYRCKVCLDGYVAPELIKKCEPYKSDAYANAPLPTFTKETDNFALAIHMFKLLMNGFTPFNGIKEDQRVSTATPGIGNQAIKRDEYCFKSGNKHMSAAVPPLDVLPAEIADLFTRAFIKGRTNPKERPSAKEWYTALNNYESALVRCKNNESHYYKKDLCKCPWCEADERYQDVTAPHLRQKTFTNPVQPIAKPVRPAINPVSPAIKPNQPMVNQPVQSRNTIYKSTNRIELLKLDNAIKESKRNAIISFFLFCMILLVFGTDLWSLLEVNSIGTALLAILIGLAGLAIMFLSPIVFVSSIISLVSNTVKRNRLNP